MQRRFRNRSTASPTSGVLGAPAPAELVEVVRSLRYAALDSCLSMLTQYALAILAIKVLKHQASHGVGCSMNSAEFSATVTY